MTTLLADFHHDCLYESLALLCDRLGWTLYRPIGMDWFDQGYWNLERKWHGDAVARQYLEPWGSDDEGVRLNTFHQRWHNLLTLEEARELKPDVVLASVAHNHEGLHRFATEVGATFGIHLGNVRFTPQDMAEDRWDLADFGIVTSILPGPVLKPHVVVHQEFSLADYVHDAPSGNTHISSFVNCFPENPVGYAQFRAVAALLPEKTWKVYGAYGQVPEDEFAGGNLDRCFGVGTTMRTSDIAWHTKQWSDGFGHVIHNWFAVGRPVLGFEWYYRNQLAGPLWQEGITSFDLTDKPPHEVADIIRSLDAERVARMSAAATRRFHDVVSFDEEEQAIRAMFAQVLW